LNAVLEYHERRRKRSRLSSKRMEMPSVVESRLMPEVIQCLHYFCNHQPRLLLRLHDSAYLCRELMYLNDPQSEGVLHWLLHLTLGIFRPAKDAGIDEELKNLTTTQDTALLKDLSDMLKEEVG